MWCVAFPSPGHRREIANSEDIVRWLNVPEFYQDEDGHLPLGAQKIQVNYILEIGTNLASQAQQFWDADLIVLSHGATTGWRDSLSVYLSIYAVVFLSSLWEMALHIINAFSHAWHCHHWDFVFCFVDPFQ